MAERRDAYPPSWVDRLHAWTDGLPVAPWIPAFAGVTATTGVVLLALGYLGVLTVPSPVANPALIASAIAFTGLAVAIFIVPLCGIRRLIAAEKSRRLEATNRLLDRALRDLRGFATALVLPVVLWFAFRALGQALG